VYTLVATDVFDQSATRPFLHSARVTHINGLGYSCGFANALCPFNIPEVFLRDNWRIFVLDMHMKACTRKEGREGIVEIIPIWIYGSEVPGMYRDFETHAVGQPTATPAYSVLMQTTQFRGKWPNDRLRFSVTAQLRPPNSER